MINFNELPNDIKTMIFSHDSFQQKKREMIEEKRINKSNWLVVMAELEDLAVITHEIYYEGSPFYTEAVTFSESLMESLKYGDSEKAIFYRYFS